MNKHLDGHGTPLLVGATVKMHATADSGYGATGTVQNLSFTANYGTPIADVKWNDGHRDVYAAPRLRVIWSPAR